MRKYRKLIRLLCRCKPDVVITHLWFANTIGRIAARIAGVPTVISFEHNVYDAVKTWKQFLADRLMQRLSNRIVAVSEAVRDSLVRHGISPDRAVVIENGIDLSRYVDAGVSDIRREKGIADGDIIFLFVGRLIEQKGVDVLLDAFAKTETTRLLIAGDGADRAQLERQAAALGISERIFFLGVRNDVPGLMKAADCLVLPSRWEGQGLVIPEAFAAGLPVIVSDFPAALSLVREGENGFIVPREGVAALARALQQVAASPTLRRKLAGGGARSAAHFAIQRHVDMLLAV